MTTSTYRFSTTVAEGISQIGTLLSGRFLRSFLAAAVNTGGSQIIRLGGNLILTRLLFPEVFGLMALVTVVLTGLEMFSDLGTGTALVQRKEKPNDVFIQTAWTIEACRGVTLWLLACLMAWPLSRFYGEPLLGLVLPVVALSLVIRGLKSQAVHLCARNFRHGAVARLDLISALIGLIVSVVLAAIFKSVWALVAGALVASLVGLLMSWQLPEQVPVRFQLDSETRVELMGFGRWIFISTVFAFLAMNGDRILLGKLLSLSELGIYTVAFFFAQSVSGFMSGIASRTLFPILSRLKVTDPEPQRYRRLLLGGALLPIGGFLIGGPWLIKFLYDERYLPAGPLLQWLAIGTGAATLRILAEPLLLARGDSFSRMILGIAEAVIVLGCTAIGGSIAGLPGFIAGFVLGQFLTLIPAAILLHRHGAWAPLDDLIYLIGIAALTSIGWLIHAPKITLSPSF